jgi:hypothetical protein
MAILRSFDRFQGEAALVGKMLAGYADLEIDLMHCVNAVRNDLNAVLKAMFRSRGESQRIEVADALGRERFGGVGLQPEFELAISSMHHCRKIRNQYAHCVWWDDNTPQLAFGAVEEIASRNVVVQLADLQPDHVTIPFLQTQLAYFNFTDDLLVWLIQVSRQAQGLQYHQGIQRPAPLAQPPLLMP